MRVNVECWCFYASAICIAPYAHNHRRHVILFMIVTNVICFCTNSNYLILNVVVEALSKKLRQLMKDV